MLNKALILTALTLIPSAAFASDVYVDVRVAGNHYDTVLEFRPERSAYVALYGHFSDGSVRPIFPDASCQTHWVEDYEVRIIDVDEYYGVRLEDVQVVASRHWFDPSEVWVTWAPSSGWGHANNSGVVVVSSSPYSMVTWSFALGWGHGSRSCSVARTWSWVPERVRWHYEDGRRYAVRLGHGRHGKHLARPHSSIKWKYDGRDRDRSWRHDDRRDDRWDRRDFDERKVTKKSVSKKVVTKSRDGQTRRVEKKSSNKRSNDARGSEKVHASKKSSGGKKASKQVASAKRTKKKAATARETSNRRKGSGEPSRRSGR